MASLLEALAAIGEPQQNPFALPSAFKGRMPPSLRKAMEGMSNPGVEQWHKVGVALYSENSELSEEAQGAATDGKLWFVCSNNLKGVVAFDDSGNRDAEFGPGPAIFEQMWEDAGSPAPPPWLAGFNPQWLAALGSSWNPHFGAPGFFDGWIHVPIQGPRGVWRFTIDGQTQVWRKADELPADDLFPWCAVHPGTGTLYTCNYRKPKKLYAYDRESLARRKDDDFTLGAGSMFLDRVQGGVFTQRGRLIMVRDDYNAVFCFSSLNGHRFGSRKLGDFGSDGSEVESVAVRSWQFNGTPAHIHILELDNDLSKDDFYLHSFQVPDPARL